jgi:hypothetical protein
MICQQRFRSQILWSVVLARRLGSCHSRLAKGPSQNKDERSAGEIPAIRPSAIPHEVRSMVIRILCDSFPRTSSPVPLAVLSMRMPRHRCL